MRRIGLVLALVLISAPIQSQSYSVSLLAGSDKGGGYRDGTGEEARFSLPSYGVLDSTGNLYIADAGNHVVRRVSSSGVVTTIAGVPGIAGFADGPANMAKFNQPRGIAIDAAGDLLVSDYRNHVIRKITRTGQVLTIAGAPGISGTSDGSGSSARFTYPSGLAVTSDGSVFVADSGNHVIRQISNGIVSTLAGEKRYPGTSDGFGTQARFNYPFDVVVAASGDLFVADTHNHSIRRVTRNGQVTTFAGLSGEEGHDDGLTYEARFSYPWGVGIAGDGWIYVADTRNHLIRKISPAGEVSTASGVARVYGTGDGGALDSHYNVPTDVVVRPNGELLIIDSENAAVRRITGGTVTTFVGSKPVGGVLDGPATRARFAYPQDVAFDSSGNLWTVSWASVVRKVAADGSVTSWAGKAFEEAATDGDRRKARFSSPTALVADNSGTLFIADSGNSTIRKIAVDGTVSTLAGKAGQPGDSDGSGAQARFDYPMGIAIDSRGVVFVADTYNHTIRTIDMNGVVSTFAGYPGYAGYYDGVGQSALFRYPIGLDFDLGGNLYVADWGNNCIRRIAPNGTVTTIAGSPGSWWSSDGHGTDAKFERPFGIAASGDGSIYVSEEDAHVVRRISKEGNVSTIAGVPYGPGNGAGVGIDARLYLPRGIAVSTSGAIAFADEGNHGIKTLAVAVPTVHFTVNPNVISPRGSAVLEWTVENATTVSIQPQVGSVGLSGSRRVTPDHTTVYTLTATGGGGTVYASVTVDVRTRRRPVRHP